MACFATCDRIIGRKIVEVVRIKRIRRAGAVTGQSELTEEGVEVLATAVNRLSTGSADLLRPVNSPLFLFLFRLLLLPLLVLFL